MQIKILTTITFILFLTSMPLIAQSDNELNEKLKNIKADVNRIVVSTENSETVFEGNEAKKLFKKMKHDSHRKIEWISDSDFDFDFDSDSDNVFIIKSLKDIELFEGNKKIQIDVEDEDGEKTVTVITEEDGEEKTETFKGKEAEEYLENLKDDGEIAINIDVDLDDDDHIIRLKQKIIEHSDEKDIKIEVKNGIKKVEVKTVIDGEENVEVFEGDEADEYLEKEKINKKRKKKVIIK